ncbi:FKBP-type peptidyl-prolyl cis-trans isomerase [Taibaiella koreensis]|uniref:FKBP-type peptidyl-prolyl cis-trans isomerase n=1 Tax=Taibaiella koreensis TaxID=1268548 RepID=UPI000E59B623|nr:FKBP-type peptidyl-prolyl cis-trans isomerase [Taibaiella koreensis]
MKNIILLAAIVGGIFIAGCSKKDTSCQAITATAPATEVAALEQFISSNKVEATKDSRGFYYRIENQGSSKHPDACSQVTVNYKGTLTTGAIFDQNNNMPFDLTGLIKGWQAGIPLIGEGGRVVLYLPPSFGYGSSQVAGIPANSILIFSIDLVKVN